MGKDIFHYFASVSDPRVIGQCDHLLSDILLIAICTYLTGRHAPVCQRAGRRVVKSIGLAQWGSSVNTFERVFSLLESATLEKGLSDYRKDILAVLSEKQIAIDGKKLRGVSPTSLGNSGLYLLNVWVSENKLCVGQRQVEDKSNEVTAIPQLLDSIDITGSIVTIDAIGTQRKIAAQIRSKEAYYLLSVKGNQQELLDDMECALKTHKGYDYYEEPDCGHGRIETRKCVILRVKEYLLEENFLAWKDVSTLVKVESIRDVNDIQNKEVRYFISDEELDKARYYNLSSV